MFVWPSYYYKYWIGKEKSASFVVKHLRVYIYIFLKFALSSTIFFSWITDLKSMSVLIWHRQKKNDAMTHDKRDNIYLYFNYDKPVFIYLFFFYIVFGALWWWWCSFFFAFKRPRVINNNGRNIFVLFKLRTNKKKRN